MNIFAAIQSKEGWRIRNKKDMQKLITVED